jgi:hypothetical protein
VPRIIGRGWGTAPRAVLATGNKVNTRRKRDRAVMSIL